MKSKFPGTCKKCGVAFRAGTAIKYNIEDKSVKHLVCPRFKKVGRE
jgi:hypothetical protein